MSAPSPHPANRSRWMDWKPEPRIFQDSAGSEPSKPTEPGFDGFVGAMPGESPKIEADPAPSDLAAILRGKALELWSDAAGGRLFIVADERDVARLNQRRGEVLTVDELRLVVKITDPAAAAEVLLWKRTFDGSLSEGENPKITPRRQK